MPISVDQAMSAYGFVYQLAKSIPELNGYLQDAIKHGWTPEKLTATVESGKWWMQNADTVRQLAILHATEPGTYKQQVANAQRLIMLKAQAMGRSFDSKTLNSLVFQTLTQNASWDDQVLTSMVSRQSVIKAGDSRLGQVAQLQDHMTQVAQSYGVAYTQKNLDGWADRIQGGFDTVDGFESLMRARAKAQYPHLAGQIDAGMTVRDVADPYLSTMAATLELDEGAIDWNKDPHIKKALAQVGQDGAMTAQPMWQFERTLKNDARYDHTKQAKDDAMSTIATIGKDFGFGGK